MKIIKVTVLLIALGSFLILGCRSNLNKQKTEQIESTSKADKSILKTEESTPPTKIENVPLENDLEDNWVAVNACDGKGHGPDLDSDEGIRAMTYRFMKNPETYRKGSDGIFVTEINKTNPEISKVNFIHRHVGEKDVFYTRSVEVKVDKVRLVADFDEIIEIEKVLEMLCRRALQNNNGNTEVEIKANSKIRDILETEDQLRAMRFPIQRIFQPDWKKMDSLWHKLSSTQTFSEWMEILKTVE